MTTCVRSICSRTGPWTVSILLFLAYPDVHLSQAGSPNLRPFQPDGWSDAIVVSDRQGDHIDTLGLTPSDRLYVDFAIINSGQLPVTHPFRIELLVDGQLWHSFAVPAPLQPQVYRFREDYPIGRLGIGTHTVRIVADAGQAVPESHESDNEYTKTIRISGACTPLTARVSPRAAGTLTPSQQPNCGGATVRVSSLSVADTAPDRELGIAGEPLVVAQRTRAFAALRAKVQSKGEVNAIVGLKTEGRSVAGEVTNLSQAEARSPLISQAQQSLLIRMSRHNLSSIRQFKFIPYIAIAVDGPALEALASDPAVVSIEEDSVVQPLLEESTPLVGAPFAWSQGYDGTARAVAILDTGVDKNHPFLKDKVVSEACFSNSFCPGGVKESTGLGSGMPCPLSNCFHGTAVAGVVAGQGTNISGVAPEAQIIAIQVFSQCGVDCISSSNSDWIAGLERALELSAGFDIAAVNMSFGRGFYSENCDDESPAAKAAMDNLQASGIAPVVASGNFGSSRNMNFPACISTAVSVGSVNDGSYGTDPDEVSAFSNRSRSLDLLAPGRPIKTSVPGGSFRQFSGTSLAAPHVAGAWALLKSKAPEASVPELLSTLKNTGIPIFDRRASLIKPRIQVDAALDSIVRELSYISGTRVTLTARPNAGFRFSSWQGCNSHSGNQCIVTMDSVNNVVAFFEPMATSTPDLTITSLIGPSTATIGGRASISAGIENQGPANAGPFRLGFYLSRDKTITPNDTWFAACAFDSGLLAGETATCSRAFPLPHRISPGRYFLGAIVDDLDRVAEGSETNNAGVTASGPIDVVAPTLSSKSFVPVVLTAAGRNQSFFTSELTLTNRGNQEASLQYTYKAHIGGGNGLASDVLAPGQQKVVPDALDYLRSLGIPIRGSGNRIGTVSVNAVGSSTLAAMVRTTTAVAEGRAGLAYPGIEDDGGFEEAVYLCGLRQNSQDRSNVAFQNMGTTADGPVTIRTTVFSGGPDDPGAGVLEDVTLEPGGFHQYSGLLGSVPSGYVKVERIGGVAPFYAYGVINDQANSDGSFVFPVTESSLAGTTGQTLPVIVETGVFSSELTVTNFSEAAKTVNFAFVADAVAAADQTAAFSIALAAGEQRIIPDIVNELRRQGLAGIGPSGPLFAGALFATVDSGDLSGIVIGARTGSPGGGGQYGVFYNAVPYGAAFGDSAWVDALQQNAENRSNLALVNTGEVDSSDSLFSLDIYDGDTGNLVKTVRNIRVPARRWRQVNSILADNAPGTRQGYVHIRKVSGNNPFLAYGIINDGGAPGGRTGDGAYVPARE